MILDEKQFEAAKKNFDKLNKSIARVDVKNECAADPVKQFEIAALKRFAIQIRQDIEEFEMLRSGGFEPPSSYRLMELPKILIQARIARGWTQKMLADKTGTNLQRLQLYEAELYFGASFSKKMQLAEVLGVDTSSCRETMSNDASKSSFNLKKEKAVEQDWAKFPVKEAYERGWIARSEKRNKIDAFKDWFNDVKGSYGTSALHRRQISDDENTHNEAILTWEARVLQMAEKELVKSTIPEFQLDERWLKDLVRLSIREDGPVLAKRALREQGVLLVVEKHLSKTRLDGAAMLSHEGVPIVALTTRLNRLDYFWFTLFHELGHVYRHLYSSSNFSFFDQRSSEADEDSSQFLGNELEDQANEFALNKLIDINTWDSCLSRYSATEKSVIADANRLKIHPSIIAGRIRHERNDYSILSSLIGQGELHKLSWRS